MSTFVWLWDVALMQTGLRRAGCRQLEDKTSSMTCPGRSVLCGAPGELARSCLIRCIMSQILFVCRKIRSAFMDFWLSLQHGVVFDAFRMSVFKPLLLS